MELNQQRCINHEQRDAVGRCPECKNFFCMECITEYETRILCTACLKKEISQEKAAKRPGINIDPFLQAVQIVFGICFLIASFWIMGQCLQIVLDPEYQSEIKFED
ncbi:MAG: hypothetical protein HRT89_14680 [Lentisphaeria bacterium]|nr:hypothetical protein [Lentisphaeria bacterium]NQZ69304.1 hypothetical protein [Lentisphaeria bacterium]